MNRTLSLKDCLGLQKIDPYYYATIVAAAAGGDWNTGGSWVGGVAPTAADDAQVPLAAGNMSVGAGAVCRSADFSTYTGTLSGTGTLTIGDATAGASSIALKLVAGMTVSGPPVFTFISTSATVQTVTFAGLTTGSVTFNAASNGSWQMTGGHTTTGTVTLTKGTLDVNGQTVNWGTFTNNSGSTRVLTLGAATVNITGSGNQPWSSTGLTITANTSTITFSGNTAAFNGGSATGLNNVVFTGNTPQISSGFTCANLTITGGNIKTASCQIFAAVTISNTLTINGNSILNRVFISSGTVGTAITLTAAVVSVSNADFMDITGAGAASWDLSSATGGSGDCGGNTMQALGAAAFTAAATQTWNGTSGGNWSANAWTSRVPLPQDNVVINAAFSASQTVTADMPRLGKSIDWTGASGTPAWSFASTANTIFGSVTLIGAMTVSGTNVTTFAGRSIFTLTSAGLQYTQAINITAPSGTYTLNDALSSAGNLTINNGGFVTSSFGVTTTLFLSSNSNTRSITLGTSTFTITGTTNSTFVNLASTTGLTFSGASATFVLSTVSVNTRTFAGGGLTFGTLTYTIAGSTGELDITGANTFTTINFSDITNARSLKFTASTTTTVGTFNVNGTAAKLMTVASITGPAFTMTSSSQQSCDYLSLTNSVVDANPKWYAGANSTDGTGNTNWIFTAPPSGGSGNSGLSAGLIDLLFPPAAN